MWKKLAVHIGDVACDDVKPALGVARQETFQRRIEFMIAERGSGGAAVNEDGV